MASNRTPAQVRTNPGEVPLDDIIPNRRSKQTPRILTPADRAELEQRGQQRLPVDVDADDADFSEVVVHTRTDHLQMLREMADALREKIKAAEDAAAVAQRTAQELAKFQTETIPQAMELAGVTSFKLEDGTELVVKDDLKCSIPKEDPLRREACFAWLRENGHGAVIKEAFVVDVRPLDEDGRAALAGKLTDLGADYEVKDDVHFMTLKSLIKEVLERGVVPPAAFGVFQFKRADLKAPKGKK